jgi:hypothetical protein
MKRTQAVVPPQCLRPDRGLDTWTRGDVTTGFWSYHQKARRDGKGWIRSCICRSTNDVTWDGPVDR